MSTKGYRRAFHKGGFVYLRKDDAPASRKEVKKIVDRKIRASEETKMRSYSLAAEVNSTITFYNISQLIAEGTGADERIGDELQMKSVRIRGRLEPKSTGVGDVARIMLIQWKPDTAADTPANGEVFEDISTVKETLSGYTTDLTHRAKFKVLMDKTFLIPAYAQINNRRDLYFTRTISGKRMSKVLYEAGGVTGAKHLYLVYVGTKTTGTSASNFYCNIIQEYME